MKTLLTCIFLLFTLPVWAQPAMSVLTVETNDKQQYHQWMRQHAMAIGKELNAMAMGVCQPSAGADTPNTLFTWAIGSSHQGLLLALNQMPTNPLIGKAITKIDQDRTITERTIWSVLLPPATSFKTGNVSHNWHVIVKATDLGGYLSSLKEYHQKSQQQGFKDIDMAVYHGNTGQYTGLSMAVAYAPSASRLGEFFDARFAPWAQQYAKQFSQQREMIRGFIMRCETMYAN